MANIKISGLNELFNSQLDVNDTLPLVDVSAPETKKIKVAELDKRYKEPTDTLSQQVSVNTIDIDALKQGQTFVVAPPTGAEATTTTTDETPTTLATAAIVLGKASLLSIKVTAVRTSGDGSEADSCCYILRTKAKNVGGTVTVSSIHVDQWKDVEEWDVNLEVVGASVAVKVTGAASTTIDWKSNIEQQTA
jgi:hypothetical protein